MSAALSELPERILTIGDLLRWRASGRPPDRAYTFLHDHGGEQSHLSYGELGKRAHAVAARLQDMGACGRRALLLYPPGLDYIVAFFGCLLAGVVAVPAYPPRLRRHVSRLQAVCEDAQAAFALSNASVLNALELRSEQFPTLNGLQWLTDGEVAEESGEDVRRPSESADTIAFIQYTSGSTGMPKGVVVTHGNLLHNMSHIQHRFENSSASTGVFWLPPYHDMGLIGGILQPLYSGSSVTLMSPFHFLRHPMRWLQTISRNRATVSGAPNFAYELCVESSTPEQRSGLDLSSWEVAFCGAETVHAQTLERFAAAFEPCGFRRETFYPCYGLAEATLMVSGGAKESAPLVHAVKRGVSESPRAGALSNGNGRVKTYVSCGWSLSDQKILIVNPETLLECRPEEVGEIWVSGPSVARGYWNRPEETERTFSAYLAGTGAGPFLRTGDLGFLKDEQLYLVGRLKDVIIIGGQNHHPQDIELTAERSHHALKLGGGAAFGVEVSGEERLVLVHEVERHHGGADSKELVSAIRRAVADEHQVHVHEVVLIKRGTLPKTSSGKPQRHLGRMGYLNATLEIWADVGDGAGSGRRRVRPVEGATAARGEGHA